MDRGRRPGWAVTEKEWECEKILSTGKKSAKGRGAKVRSSLESDGAERKKECVITSALMCIAGSKGAYLGCTSGYRNLTLLRISI